jgi:hypothetical protein
MTNDDFHLLFKKFASEDLKIFLKTTNEFKLFDDTLTYIKQKNSNFFSHIEATLSAGRIKTIEVIRKFQKISTNENAPIFRKIVKLKRK